jgi:carbonic anhydrase/acetyltransferase-like protein (isoleucine patch superfamily)
MADYNRVSEQERYTFMIVEFEGYRPRVSATAFIASTAVLVGNVIIEDDASVWYGAVLRADHGEPAIIVGAGSNVQDNCVIHVAEDRGTTLGKSVTVGHGAILEGCDIDDDALIGMNAVVLDHARVGAGSLVAAGATVLAGMQIPPGQLVAGSPARVKKAIEGNSAVWIEHSARYYTELARRYRAGGLDLE